MQLLTLVRSALSVLFSIGRAVVRTFLPQMVAAGRTAVQAAASPLTVVVTWIWQAAIPFVVALFVDLFTNLRSTWVDVRDFRPVQPALT